MKLTYIGNDDWSRPVYKDENERLWKDVTPVKDKQPDLCTCYNNQFNGEPDTNMCYVKRYDDVEIEFIPERITWY